LVRALAQGYVCVDTESDSLDATEGQFGWSLAADPARACYIPLSPIAAGRRLTCSVMAFWRADEQEKSLEITGSRSAGFHVLKIGQNLKYDITGAPIPGNWLGGSSPSR
jgi:DNA polymerase-1